MKFPPKVKVRPLAKAHRVSSWRLPLSAARHRREYRHAAPPLPVVFPSGLKKPKKNKSGR